MTEPELRTGGSDDFKLAVANLIGGTSAAAASTTLLANQWISLHSGDPMIATPDYQQVGASEITTGTGRQKVTWAPAVSDNSSSPSVGRINGNELTFTITGADITVSHYGVWSAATGGKFLYGKLLSTSVTLTAGNIVKITPTHAFSLKP